MLETAEVLSIGTNAVKDVLESRGVLRYSKKRSKARLSLSDSWLTGWLLGDGCLIMTGRFVVAAMTVKHKAYADHCRAYLASMGLYPGVLSFRVDSLRGVPQFHFNSEGHPDLVPLRDLWYPGGNKTIPSSLKLDPLSIREWYLKNGSLYLSQNLIEVPSFLLGGLSQQEVDLLKSKLEEFLGGNVSVFSQVRQGIRRRVSWRFCIPTVLRDKFYRIIGGSPCDIYSYKWPFKYRSLPILEPVDFKVDDTSIEVKPHFTLNSFLPILDYLELKFQRGAIVGSDKVDIYVPSLGLALDFHDIYKPGDREWAVRGALMSKSDRLASSGVGLYHFWSYHDPVKIFNMFKHILGVSNRRFGARQLDCGIVPQFVAKQFFDLYHLHGNARALWTVGLYHKGELICCLSFRPNNDRWEIARFAVKFGYSVSGGFSRMLSFARKQIRWRDKNGLITYADRDWSPIASQCVYAKVGFTFEGKTPPSMCYTNGIAVFSRQDFQKYKLASLFPYSFDKNLTEQQILAKEGFFPVFNSGNWRFIA